MGASILRSRYHPQPWNAVKPNSRLHDAFTPGEVKLVLGLTKRISPPICGWSSPCSTAVRSISPFGGVRSSVAVTLRKVNSNGYSGGYTIPGQRSSPLQTVASSRFNRLARRQTVPQSGYLFVLDRTGGISKSRTFGQYRLRLI